MRMKHLYVESVSHTLWNISNFVSTKNEKEDNTKIKSSNYDDKIDDLFEIQDSGYNNILGTKFSEINEVKIFSNNSESDENIKELFGKSISKISVSNKLNYNGSWLINEEYSLIRSGIENLVNLLRKIQQKYFEEKLLYDELLKKIKKKNNFFWKNKQGKI